MISRFGAITAAAIALIAIAAVRAWAQDGGPKVGEMAPDFSLKGSTKDGLLATPVRLSDLRGQTVVLAFFPKARTKG